MFDLKNKKFILHTLGCRVNQFDSDVILNDLQKAGATPADLNDNVDLFLINTCTVTHRADQEVKRLVRRFKAKHPDSKIVLTGCLAQRDPKFLSKLKEVDLILGQKEKSDILTHLQSFSSIVQVSTWEDNNVLKFPQNIIKPQRTRAFYKIQDGCNSHCAYCAVPQARGPSRSLPLDDILKGLGDYYQIGLKEVVLCGIHLGYWGLDLGPPLSLDVLLAKMSAKLPFLAADNFRIRLSSLEPLELNSRIITFFEKFPWLMPHVHVPIQSASNRILTKMERFCDLNFLKEKLWKLKEAKPFLALGTDFMVGFPGESEADFQASYDFVDSLPFTYGHVFPYSKRKGTKAADLDKQIPTKVKKTRAALLRELFARKNNDFKKKNFERITWGLVENEEDKWGRIKILSDNYLTLTLNPDNFVKKDNLKGKLVKLKILAPTEENNLLSAQILKES